MPLIGTSIPQFYPEQQSTIAVTTTSASVTVGNAGDTVLLYNDGGNTCFVVFGATSATATAGGVATAANDGGMWMPPGVIMSFRVPDTLISQPLVVAAICASGTTVLRLSRGSGV